MTSVRHILLPALAAAALALAEETPPEKGAKEPAPAEEPDEASPEQAVRLRFMAAYPSAQTPDKKAEAAELLRGVKEERSLRLIVGMLGSPHEAVRKAACGVMAGTPDPDGYFVKPLMGILTDRSAPVRMAAADALGCASVRSNAIKALAYALMGIAGSGKREDVVTQAKVVDAYDRALQKLTSQRSTARDTRGIADFWMAYWLQHGEKLRDEEAKAKEKAAPERPAGLPKDSFDKQ
jgi:HEAT repeat protein